MGGRHSHALGPSPTQGLLGPSHQWRHKSRASLRDPRCAHGVADTSQEVVHDNSFPEPFRSRTNGPILAKGDATLPSRSACTYRLNADIPSTSLQCLIWHYLFAPGPTGSTTLRLSKCHATRSLELMWSALEHSLTLAHTSTL